MKEKSQKKEENTKGEVHKKKKNSLFTCQFIIHCGIRHSLILNSHVNFSILIRISDPQKYCPNMLNGKGKKYCY